MPSRQVTGKGAIRMGGPFFTFAFLKWGKISLWDA